MERKFKDELDDDFASLVRLLIEQQKGIKSLVEDFAKDIEHIKVLADSIPVIISEFNAIKREFDNEKKMRTDCQGRLDVRFTEILQKREGIKERIAGLENDLNQKLFNQSRYCSEGLEKLRTELENKTDSKIKTLGESIRDLQQDIKKLTGEAGKTGGIVAIVISLVMYLMKTIYDNVITK